MSQTSYSLNMAPAVAGMIVYAGGEDRTVLTYKNPVDTIYWGHMVAKVAGTAGAIEQPDGSGAVLLGAAIRDTSSSDSNYPAKSAVAVMRRGQIWMPVEEDVTEDDAVFVRHTGKKQVQTLVASADFVTGNTITGTVNGTGVSVAFDTSNQITLEALAAAIALVNKVNGVTDDNSHTLTITSDQDESVVLEDFEVTGGASQATFAVAETTAGIPNSDRGKLRTDADSSTAVALTTAKFIGSSVGGLAPVDLNIA